MRISLQKCLVYPHLEGNENKWSKVINNDSLALFLKENEKPIKLHSEFDCDELSTPCKHVYLMIMKVSSLEGWFKVYYYYHLPLLNHFFHNAFISFHLFLLNSLENSIKYSMELAKKIEQEAHPTPPSAHFYLCHFHLPLCPPKPILWWKFPHSDYQPIAIILGSVGGHQNKKKCVHIRGATKASPCK